MFANSRAVTSPQDAPHARLAAVVARHLAQPWRRRPSDAGRQAFGALVDALAEANGRFVVDAGCGTGDSTLALAHAMPGTLVVGLDKSRARLARLDAARATWPHNLLLARIDLVDFWQLAAERHLRCAKQWLLYPNPWPKAAQLQRRWHAHPVWPALLALGGEIELRTNWPVYAQEFAAALQASGRTASVDHLPAQAPAMSPFERKYAASGHTLWRCLAPA